MDDGAEGERERHVHRVRGLFGDGPGLADARDRTVGATEDRQRQGRVAPARDTRVTPVEYRVRAVQRRIVERDSPLRPGAGLTRLTEVDERGSERVVRLDQQRVVRRPARDLVDLVGQLAPLPEPAAHDGEGPQAAQHREVLRALAQVTAELAGAPKGRFDLRRAVALAGHEGEPEKRLQRELRLGLLAGHRRGGDERERLAEIADRLEVCGAFHRAVARDEPVVDRLRAEPALGAVVRDQLGLAGRHVREAFGQHLRDPPMVLLAGALQERLVCRVVNESVLEGIGDRCRRSRGSPRRPCRARTAATSPGSCGGGRCGRRRCPWRRTRCRARSRDTG